MSPKQTEFYMVYLVLNQASLEPSKRGDGKFNLLIRMVTLRDEHFKYIKHLPINEKVLKHLDKARVPLEEWTDE